MNNSIIISNDISLLDALGIMDKNSRKLLVVCDNDLFLGVVSIGDIQRAILKKQDLSLPVSSVIRKKVTYALVTDDINLVKERMKENRIESMPIIDNDGRLQDIIEWEDLFLAEDNKKAENLGLPVVIMAGGKGTRLLPLTNVIPKPLIPISDKTIIEEIMSKFVDSGCDRFYISVNYMMDIIKDYFNKKDNWNVEFIQEKMPLGTGGSLYLLKNKINSTFFVTNCDTLVDIDLNALLEYHRSSGNIITTVAALKTIKIPYGTLETKVNGVVDKVTEKPNLLFQINSGFYVLEPEVLNYIEDEVFLNLPELIQRLIDDGHKVGAFPVPEGSWIDMGNWDEYLRLVNIYSGNKPTE